ncbi:MAG: ABC transporter ATP-binding protein [Actinobacteria bacterium]|nr:ABC transporter ATP-binding protein [Actinomycetota bacterium]MCI0678016.1 ABC transporter ATP-binding protein [Actinomycetota bacterium]
MTTTPANDRAEPLLEVRDLSVGFPTREGLVRAVDRVSFSINPGEVVGFVGESGSGKTVTALAVMGLVAAQGAIESGSIRFRGREMIGLPEGEWRRVRAREVATVFQDPMTALNPVFSVGHQISEVLRTHLALGRQEARERAVELLGMVGIPDARARAGDYPHQFSGGMRQRVMIAMALSCDPSLIIADEPTTALDVTIQAEILDLIRSLSTDMGVAVMIISHDLGVMSAMADRINVMYAGQIVESASAVRVLVGPRHPYTRALLQSLPRVEGQAILTAIEGAPPDLISLPMGCRFYPRCPFRGDDRCRDSNPDLREVDTGHWVRSFYDLEPVA